VGIFFTYNKDWCNIFIMDIKLIIDDRERAITKHIVEFKEINYEITRITTADYIVVNPTTGQVISAIERKSLEDFAASIKDGRSENVAKLIDLRSKTGCRIIYLIEGELAPKQEREIAHFKYKVIESAIFHLIARDGVCILRTTDTLDTAKMLVRFVDSMKTMKKFEGGQIEEITELANTELTAMITQKYIKSDLDIVREIWAIFRGITPSNADEYIRCWSLSDIVCRRISREDIHGHKLSSGRKINKTVANSLAGIDGATESRMLCGIPQISKTSTNYIVMRKPLADLLALNSTELAEININDKKKIGAKIAENILRIFNYRAETIG
jgi:ERCC4-type nuclease